MKPYIAAALIAFLLSGCSDSIDTSVKKLKSDNAPTRIMGQNELIGQKGNPAAVKKVIALLNDSQERTVFLAIQVLGEMKDSTAVNPLREMAKNPNPVFRAAAAHSLGKIGSASVLPILEEALSDTSKEVRANAVTALGALNNLASLSKIYGMMRDPAPSVRAAAIQALYVFSALPEAGIKASDFQGAVQDSFNVVRYVAAQALGKAYPDTVIATALLFNLLDDQDANVRVEAIRSLGKIHCVRAVPILKKNFVYSPFEVQTAISETIKQLTGEEFPKRK